MTRDDLAVVSELFERRADGDLPGMLELIDPDVEAYALSEGGRQYQGHDGVREYFRELAEEGRRVDTISQRLVEVQPGCVLSVGRLHVRDAQGGVLDTPGVWAFYVRGGKVVRIDSYASEQEALAALADRR